MSAVWFASIDGVARGPFDASTIRSMAACGDLKPTDHLRRGEDGEWVAAANTKGLEFGSPWVPLAPPVLPAPQVQAYAYPPPPARRVVAELAPQYVYKMVQIPPTIEIQEGTSTKGRAASYLENVVNDYAHQGWEFFRVDSIGIWVNPGCLWGLFGARPVLYTKYVITFRKPV